MKNHDLNKEFDEVETIEFYDHLDNPLKEEGIVPSEVRIVSGECIGEYHEKNHGALQDDISIYTDGYDFCIALSDGAGSVDNSEIASHAITNAVTKDFEMNRPIWQTINKDLLKQRILDLSIRAMKDKGMEAECTLLVSARVQDRMLFIHIGDGLMLNHHESSTDVISYPENGKYANETFFLSSKNALEHIRVQEKHINEFRDGVIILTSDGAEHLLYDFVNKKPAEAIEIMSGWFDENENDQVIAEQLQESISTIFREYTQDDISIVLIRIESL